MKAIICIFVFMGLACTWVYADIISSNTSGGQWSDPDTWQGFVIPGADDDVIINGPVLITGTVSCHNLSIAGPSASLRNVSNQHGTINVLGSFENYGLVSSSVGSYHLNLNIFGDITIGYDMNPRTVVISGEGNRTLSCLNSTPLKAELSIEIQDTVDTLFAAGNVFIQKGGSSAVHLKGSTEQAQIFLPLLGDSSPSHLTLIDCKMEDIQITGNSGSNLNVLVPATGSGSFHKDLLLRDLSVSGTLYLQTGLVFENVSNTGTIYNINTYADIHWYGALENSGTIASNPSGYALRLHTYGNINNQGDISIQYLYIKGEGDRVFSAAPESPFTIANTIDVSEDAGIIYAGSNLSFTAGSFEGPAQMKAYSPTLQAYSIHFDNPLISYLDLEGIVGSILSASTARFINSELSNLRLEGDISLASGCQLYDVCNYGNLQNSVSGSQTTTIWGNFENHGMVRNNPVGYSFTVYAMNDVLNYGSWTCYRLDLRGEEAQSISFGQPYPFESSYLNRSQSNQPVILLDDLYASNSELSLNHSPLDLGVADYSIHTQNVAIRNCSIISGLGSGLYMSQNCSFYTVGFQSITNYGYLNIGSTTIFTGDIVNQGTIQNSTNGSQILKVDGYLHNYGDIRDRPNTYTLSVQVKGEVLNFGSWSGNSLNLTGSTAQNIRFGPAHPLAVSNFGKTASSGSIIVVGEDLYIQNCSINLGSNALIVNEGDWDIHMQSSYLSSGSVAANIVSNQNCELWFDANSWIQNLSLQTLTNRGTLNIRSNTILDGSLYNYGTIQNQTGSISLTVMQDIFNYGALISNPGGYSFTLNAWGGVINRGDLGCHALNLYGEEDQLISFPQDYPLTASSMTDQNASSALYSDTDLYFSQCTVNLSGAQLALSSGPIDLYLDAGFLSNAVVLSTTDSNLDVSGASYIASCSFQSISFSGLISINSNTLISGDLINNGIIQNYPSSSYTLTIGGNLSNNGTISTNLTSYNLYINLAGHLVNNGSIELANLYLDGTNEQQISNFGSLGCENLMDLVSTSPVRLMTDLMLQNVSFDMRSATLILSSPTRQAHSLGLDGGYLNRAVVEGGNGARIVLENNAYLVNVQADELIWEGTGQVSSSVVIGTLHNYAAITNYPSSSQTLNVGELHNYGQLTDHPSYNLSLNLSGNLYNYEHLDLRTINFSALSDQSIYQSAASDTIRIENLYKTGSGNLIMLSDLRIKGATIDLNDHSLIMHGNPTDYGLYLRDCNLNDIYLDSWQYAVLSLLGNCRLTDTTARNLQIWGTAPVYGNSAFDNLSNHALLSNSSSGSQGIHIAGNLINNGQVANAYGYSFVVYIGGDLINYGTMSNHQIVMNGLIDQEILVAGLISVPNIVLASDLGIAQWWHDGNYTGVSTTTYNIGAIGPGVMGNWQTYNTATETWGRIIHIYAGQTITSPTGLTISRSGSSLVFLWNQVPGAAGYKIYASDGPETGFGLLMDQIIDNNTGDGIVQQILPVEEPGRFYRVTAYN